MTYVHGYDEREIERLRNQAGALVDLLHHDTAYPAGSRVLEAGCGVGAQTVALVTRSPLTNFTAVDVSSASLARARARVIAWGNVQFLQANVFALPFAPASFDDAFVCFLLEHLADPAGALERLISVVKPGGTVTVIEGDHGSAYFHPDSAAAQATIDALVELQGRRGGNARIGRGLYPLLASAGLEDVFVTPRVVYADGRRPELVDAFTRRTFTAMVEGVREPVIAEGLLEEKAFDAGIRDLYRTAEPDGSFSYTFFKGVGRVRS